jgi:ABC-type transporter Mla subunit MlaD
MSQAKANKLMNNVKKNFNDLISNAEKAKELFAKQQQENRDQISQLQAQIGNLENNNTEIESSKQEMETIANNIRKMMENKI